jgi:hypothetical protein
MELIQMRELTMIEIEDINGGRRATIAAAFEVAGAFFNGMDIGGVINSAIEYIQGHNNYGNPADVYTSGGWVG